MRMQNAAAARRGFGRAIIIALLVAAGCRAERTSPERGVGAASVTDDPTTARDTVDAAVDTLIPAGPAGDAIRRGHAILANTRDSLPGYAGNQLRCMSCHLEDGRRLNGSTWIGVYARYPQYRARSATVETIEFRINDCLKRSMNGAALPADSREMRDMVAYFAFLSRGIPVGAAVRGQGLPRMPAVAGDSARGADLFRSTCAVCHGADGAGTAVGPPLWGPDSYNIGAGMARVRTAASFIKHNMPLDRPGLLSDQQALDVAAYINSQPRRDFPGKELDWPNGDPPPDVAYETKAARRR